MMDWHSIYIVDKKIFLFENVAFSQFLTLEIADSEKLRHKHKHTITRDQKYPKNLEDARWKRINEKASQ